MESFSQKIKQEISTFSPKTRICCIYSFLYGMTFPQKSDEARYFIKTTNVENTNKLYETLNNLLQKKNNFISKKGCQILINKEVVRYSTFAEIEKNVFKCPHCQELFLRGVFYSCGTANSLTKERRLELNFSNFENALDFKQALNERNVSFNSFTRNSKCVLYIKRSELIEDFLALMGANNAAFDLINSKINNEVRNVANRATNCDSANINKILSTSKTHINAINEIISGGYFDDMPISLQEIARARLDYPDINFQELGKRLNPPISKSGVHHRLEKIMTFYEKIKK